MDNEAFKQAINELLSMTDDDFINFLFNNSISFRQEIIKKVPKYCNLQKESNQ